MGSKKKSKRQEKRIPLWLGLVGSLFVSAVVMLSGQRGLMRDIELKLYDARFVWRGPQNVDSSDIVIVAVDDESFATLGSSWPFPRSWYARLIRNLSNAGARLIVFDIQFVEPDRGGPAEDLELARATGEFADKIIHCGKISVYRHPRIDKEIKQVVEPTEVIRETGAHFGIVNYDPDRDGFIRQYRTFIEKDSINYLPLAVKSYQILMDLPSDQFFRDDPEKIVFGDREIPRMARGMPTMLINFYGPAKTFKTFSLASVLDDTEFNLMKDDTDYMQWFVMPEDEFDIMTMVMPEEAADVFRDLRDENPFKDKIVFIGASAAELQDNKKTPFYTYTQPGEGDYQETPGVEVHASALQTLLDESFITNVKPLQEFILIFILAFGVFLVSNYFKLTPGIVFTLLLLIVLILGVFYLFINHRIWISLAMPALSILFAWIVTTVIRYIIVQREKAMIKGMFSQYVPKKVVSELIDNPDMLKLGGEKRRMTALFTDVAGFTSVSEKLSPEELVHLLNEYLSEMSRICLDNEGIIDKYEGDLIMAEWGAPIFFQNHAEKACIAALNMQKRLAELRQQWHGEGRPELFSRVGINTGEMIVGNMGCLEVFDYTVMGDAVNLASRLEGANKSYGTSIMIGPETRADISDTFITRTLDDIRVKGKLEPVRVYELIASNADDVSPGKLQMLPVFETALEHYRGMKFSEAKSSFEKALQLDPDDGPVKTYLERCQLFIETPPADDWDGVFTLTEK